MCIHKMPCILTVTCVCRIRAVKKSSDRSTVHKTIDAFLTCAYITMFFWMIMSQAIIFSTLLYYLHTMQQVYVCGIKNALFLPTQAWNMTWHLWLIRIKQVNKQNTKVMKNKYRHINYSNQHIGQFSDGYILGIKSCLKEENNVL